MSIFSTLFAVLTCLFMSVTTTVILPDYVPPATQAQLETTAAADEEIVQQVLDSLGEDLIARLKAADIDLSFSFGCLTPGGEPSADCLMTISIELRSAIGSVRYGDYQLDEALFREAQMAIIDSGVFGLSDEDVATLKANGYAQKNHPDIDLACGVNMHVNHTPSDEAIMYLRHTGDRPTGYARWWYSNWEWDTLSYNNKP